MPIPGTGFDQANFVTSGPSQARGQNATGGPGADDDIVEFVHGRIYSQAPSAGAAIRQAVETRSISIRLLSFVGDLIAQEPAQYLSRGRLWDLVDKPDLVKLFVGGQGF